MTTPNILQPTNNLSFGPLVATSLALGGATLGTDTLAVTGTSTFSGSITTLVGSSISSGQSISLRSTGILSWAGSRGILSSPVAGQIQFGNIDSATPVTQTISFQSVVAGTTNTAASSATVTAPRGTGTGAGGALVFQTAPAGTTGSAQNTLVTALTIGADTAQTVTATGPVMAGSFSPTSSTVPIVGMYSGTGTTLDFATTSTSRLTIGTTTVTINGVQLRGGISTSWALGNSAPSGTVPSFSPNRADTTTGLGAQAAGNISFIANAIEQARVTSTGMSIQNGVFNLKTFIVSGLPSAATSGVGATAFVTDASTTVILGLGLTVVGGGANKVPVYSDGTNWIIG